MTSQNLIICFSGKKILDLKSLDGTLALVFMNTLNLVFKKPIDKRGCMAKEGVKCFRMDRNSYVDWP